jgi:hypothetical protein
VEGDIEMVVNPVKNLNIGVELGDLPEGLGDILSEVGSIASKAVKELSTKIIEKIQGTIREVGETYKSLFKEESLRIVAEGDTIPNPVEVDKLAHSVALAAARDILKGLKKGTLKEAVNESVDQMVKDTKDLVKEGALEFCSEELVPTVNEEVRSGMGNNPAYASLPVDRVATLIRGKFEGLVESAFGKVVDVAFNPSSAKDALNEMKAAAMDVGGELEDDLAGDLAADLGDTVKGGLPEGVDTTKYKETMDKVNGVVKEVTGGVELEEVAEMVRKKVTGGLEAFKEAVEGALVEEPTEVQKALEAGLEVASEAVGPVSAGEAKAAAKEFVGGVIDHHV